MTYTVFVSHSSRDTELIAHTRSVAAHARVSLYLAEHDNQAGRSIAQKVQENIDRSDAVLVLLTHAGYSSTYVQQEIGYALRARKVVIPLLSRLVRMGQQLQHIGIKLVHPLLAYPGLSWAARHHRLLFRDNRDLDHNRSPLPYRCSAAILP
jgi:hypothetical protein